MRRAEPGHEEDRERFRDAAEQEWRRSRSRFVANKWRTPTLYLRRAGAGLAAADTVDWLVRNPGEREGLKGFGYRINSDVFGGEMATEAQKRKRKDPAFAEYGSHTAGHFWCELLSELALTLHRIGNVTDQVPEEVKAVLRESENAPDWGPVRSALADTALDGLWKIAQEAFASNPKTLSRGLRLLALLICPDPGAHERVTEASVGPLAREVFSEETEGRLEFAQLLGD
ncbi:hypothetical protein GCM10007147_13060 [Nocardiopsis kunsanensis]|uniref:Uncharacterized protein n=2 Tax=Nocardiopsis kunsanensis TaxID=141693 RepID=A0A919CGR5_9ACTN|nr:hypothetical protein GCM10007147_13060 [Nocardiopsis kunsanensis]